MSCGSVAWRGVVKGVAAFPGAECEGGTPSRQPAGCRRYFVIAKAAMNITLNATARLSSFQPSFRTASGAGFWMK